MNSFLSPPYDVVINFVLIKNGSVDENLRYAQALAQFCEVSCTQTLLHVSSISSYPRDATRVIESSPIAATGIQRGPYANIKTEVDHLLAAKCSQGQVSFLRPGFIVEPSQPPTSLTGIARRLPGGLHILMGDSSTPLPLLDRTEFHMAVERIVASESRRDCYLLFSNQRNTKLDFAKKLADGPILPMPRLPTLIAARTLRALRVFNERQLAQVSGLFCSSEFDSSETEAALGMRFT